MCVLVSPVTLFLLHCMNPSVHGKPRLNIWHDKRQSVRLSLLENMHVLVGVCMACLDIEYNRYFRNFFLANMRFFRQ